VAITMVAHYRAGRLIVDHIFRAAAFVFG
jgi:hypothetical protein